MSTGIYYIKNNTNNKEYIGSSIDIEKRFKRHIKDLNKNTHHNILLQRSWNKYGDDVFEFGIIVIVENKTKLLEVEQAYLDILPNLFNIAPACGGDILTNHPNKEEIIKKIKKTLISKNSLLSKKEKIEKWAKYGKDNGNYKDGFGNKKKCPKCNKNLIKKRDKGCDDCRDRNGVNNSFYGKKHSKETRLFISELYKERYSNMTLEEKIKNKKIRCVEIEGILYSGVFVAAKYLKVVSGTICHRIKSPNKLYINYHYIDDIEYILSKDIKE